jgi:hypothetical protein
MHVDHVDVSWDGQKSKWLIRIAAGEEVIRRHCDIGKNADEQTLRAAAQKTVQEEGYDHEVSAINIHR